MPPYRPRVRGYFTTIPVVIAEPDMEFFNTLDIKTQRLIRERAGYLIHSNLNEVRERMGLPEVH